jgi:hypothetical protein
VISRSPTSAQAGPVRILAVALSPFGAPRLGLQRTHVDSTFRLGAKADLAAGSSTTVLCFRRGSLRAYERASERVASGELLAIAGWLTLHG